MKFLMFFKNKRIAPDPFEKFGKKRSVYHLFFQEGMRRGFEMYIGSGLDSFEKNLTFSNVLRYNGEIFIQEKEKIKVDAVYDRSGGLYFPPKRLDKVLNKLDFKELCADKNATYLLLKDFMPKNFEIKNQEELQQALKDFSKKEFAVLKPVNDFGGKGIIIGEIGEIAKAKIETGKRYVLQQFIDTSAGIPDVVDGMHDLRIIIVNGKIIMAHVREPKKGSYLANVSAGGSIKEVELSKVPENIIETAEEIKKIIDKKYNQPIYSIDLGVENGRPFVFELNDQIGFPSEEMIGNKQFIFSLLDSLEILVK